MISNTYCSENFIRYSGNIYSCYICRDVNVVLAAVGIINLSCHRLNSLSAVTVFRLDCYRRIAVRCVNLQRLLLLLLIRSTLILGYRYRNIKCRAYCESRNIDLSRSAGSNICAASILVCNFKIPTAMYRCKVDVCDTRRSECVMNDSVCTVIIKRLNS